MTPAGRPTGFDDSLVDALAAEPQLPAVRLANVRRPVFSRHLTLLQRHVALFGAATCRVIGTPRERGNAG